MDVNKSTNHTHSPTIFDQPHIFSDPKNPFLHKKSEDTHSYINIFSSHLQIYSTVMLSFLIFIFIFPNPCQSSSHLCHSQDKTALLSFKHSFSNPNPFPSWDPLFDCCDWYGVTCNDTTNLVTGLNIISDDLNGTIPPSLSDLKHLQVLRIHKIPNLVGEIPLEISKLSNLRSLTISWTNISGPIPEFLVHLKNLAYLDLSFNRLSGSIPPSLATLPYLRAIDFSRNRLTGPIPESFGHIPKTAEFPLLTLSHNKLSGEIPPSLSNVNFSFIDISWNTLSGDASVFFGLGKATDTIVISRNDFEFDLSKVEFMEFLITLDVSHNRVYGRIPQQITDAVFLQQLNVSYNRLCGKIPTGWKLRYKKDNWDNSSFFHNRCLCGVPLVIPCNDANGYDDDDDMMQ